MPYPSYNPADKNYESPIKTAISPDFRYPSEADKQKQLSGWDRFNRRRHENYNYLAGAKAFRQSDKGKLGAEKEMQRKLSSLQRSAPKLAAGLAKGKKRAVAKFVGSLLSQIDWTIDWLFILLASFGLLKDIFDIAFAALGAIPVLGTAGAAVGIIVSFVGDLMFLILVVTVLVLVGSSLKNRGMAKYFIGIAMEFIAEALPAISWLPWTFIYVFILYGCVLYDRAYGRQAETAAQTENQSAEPAAEAVPQASV